MFDKIKGKEKKEQTDLTKERNVRCIPAAKELMALAVQCEIGDKTPEELFKAYVPFVQDIMRILMKHGVRLSEVTYVFRLALQPLTILQQTVNESLDKHLQEVEKTFWGKPGSEVTVTELDAKLKEVK